MGLNTTEENSHKTTDYVMKIFSYLNETVIYMFLGFYLLMGPRTWNTGFVLLTLLLCVLYRTLGVVLQAFLASRLHLLKLAQLNNASLSYSAIRGVCALSLASLLEENAFPEKHFMLTTVVIVIFFTVFIQGTLLQSLLDFLQLCCGRLQNRQLMEPTDNTSMQPIVGPIQNIANCHDEREFRQKMLKVSNLYLKPVFLHVQTLKSSLLSVIELYVKTRVEKDAESVTATSDDAPISADWPAGHVFQKLSIQPKDLKSSLSESDLTQNDRHNSIPMPDATSNTCLDLAALEALETRKMKDDSKIHHLMEGITFKHSIRVLKFKRHSEPEPDMDEDHHHARYHLRKLVNPVYHDHQHGHHSYSLGIHRHSKKDFGDIFADSEMGTERPRKNVSFADQSDIAEALGMFAERTRCPARKASDNDDGDIGITFTAQSETPPIEDERSKIRTAVESLLPWKRNTGREPVSSSLTHSLPEDDKPPVSEAPSWVMNEGDTNIPGVCLEDINAFHLSQEEVFTHQHLADTGSENRSSNHSSEGHNSVHVSDDELTHNLGNFQFTFDNVTETGFSGNTENLHGNAENLHGGLENVHEAAEKIEKTDSEENGVEISHMYREISVCESSEVEFSWMGSPSSFTNGCTSNPEANQIDMNVLPAPWRTNQDQDAVVSPCSSHVTTPVFEVDGGHLPGAMELPLPWRDAEIPQSLPSPSTPVSTWHEESSSSNHSFPWKEDRGSDHHDNRGGVTLPLPWDTTCDSKHLSQEDKISELDLTHGDFGTHRYECYHRSRSQPGSEYNGCRYSKNENETEAVTDNEAPLCRSNSCPVETGAVPPPPWRCSNSDHYESSVSLPPPWRCSSSDVCQEEDKAAILPPPWKNNSDEHEALEIGAVPPPPWRSNGDPTELPVRSPSASQDIDYCSIRPQASQQSFKLSEAESKHSEQISIPQIMEMPLRFYAEGDLSEGDSDEEDGDLVAEMDFTERIEKWLDTIDPAVGPFDEEWEDYNKQMDNAVS